MKKKKIAILGSTGSIGTQTLDLVRTNKDIEVLALSAYTNIVVLEGQIREFRPRLVAVWTEENAKILRKNIADLDVEVRTGMDGLLAVSTMVGCEMLLTAVVGMIGIEPTIAAIEAGIDIALANKETLVCAGHIIMPLAKEKNVSILPVDSEHSAIFQCLQGRADNSIAKILLTASGGPFRGYTKERLLSVELEDALKHPNWSMGKKITIDSATMVNKGLEMIEAKWLFDVDIEQIEVLVQPQSIVHSMVEFADGGILAQLGTPDMKLPISYALYYPHRRHISGDRLDFHALTKLDFSLPDLEVFEGLELAIMAIKKGGNMPTIYNSANEYAVALFLEKKIRFVDIVMLIKEAMSDVTFIENPSVADILHTQKITIERLKRI